MNGDTKLDVTMSQRQEDLQKAGSTSNESQDGQTQEKGETTTRGNDEAGDQMETEAEDPQRAEVSEIKEGEAEHNYTSFNEILTIKDQQESIDCDNNKEQTDGSTLFTVISAIFSELTASKNGKPTASYDESEPSSSGCNKVKASQANGDSGISMEKSGNSSDEDSNKCRKSTDNECDTSTQEDESEAGTASKFHKLKSKVKKRKIVKISSNILKRIHDVEVRGTADDDDDEEDEDETTAEDEINDWTSDTEDDLKEESDGDTPAYLKKEQPKPTWLVVPELLSREMGNNSLFARRYYGSLHVVERFKLMHKLKGHQGCVNALNFNQKGNLLASGSDDLAVVIWDWSPGKKHSTFESGHTSNLFQAKWLPFDVENLIATCARDGAVRLLDINHGVSRKIASHYAPTHKLAMHPDTPHVIISVGEDGRVLSIDVRDSTPTDLLGVKDGDYTVQLYSVHMNPLKSNEFCVAGRSRIVRLYDRRKVSKPLCTFCPQHLDEIKFGQVTCAVFNYNGTEVLASYNEEDIYLFDAVNPEPGEFAHRYQGHWNNATVKGVNYFGPKSEFVMSGSDCGSIFVWEKNTEAIVQWVKGDEQGAVNCLEPHPHIPVLATSGLDYDVKIWAPMYDALAPLTGLKSRVRQNARNSAPGAVLRPDSLEAQMVYSLMRHIHESGIVRGMNAHSRSEWSVYEVEDEDDDDSSDHSDSQSEWDESRGRTLQCPPS